MDSVISFLERTYGKYWSETRFPSGAYSFPLSENTSEIIRRHVTTVILSITSKCNSRCNVCTSDGTRMEHLSIDDFNHILEKIGTDKNIILYGGEPTVHENLVDFFRMVRESGNVPSFYTNGLKLSNYNYAAGIREHVDVLSLSFDGFGGELYKRLRGDSGQFERKMAALINLKELGFKVNLSSTILRGFNLDQLDEILHFVVENNDFIKSWIVLPAVHVGKFDLKWDGITVLDVFSRLEKSTTRLVELDYFVESKKFYSKLNNLFSKLGIIFPHGGVFYHTFFLVEDGKLERLFDIDDLRDFNSSSLFNMVRSVIKIIVKRPFLLNYLLLSKSPTKKLQNSLLGRNLLSLRIHELITNRNFRNIEYHTVLIRKKNGKFWVDHGVRGDDLCPQRFTA
jgi:MoaA/NifB/PqqE/SkfB family radical SAM enzyme